jgi:nitrate/nitrite transporter NarK
MPACVKLISVFYEPDKREKALSILGLGQGAGVILAFTAIPAVMISGNYRWGTVFVAVFCLVIASFAVLTLRKIQSKELTNLHFDEKTRSRDSLQGILNRKMIMLILINFSGSAVLFGILTWAPIYLSGIFQGPYAYVGLISAIAGITNLLGSYSGALSAKKWGGKKTIVASMLMCAILPFAMIYVDPLVVILVVALLGWCTMLYFAPLWALIPSSVEKGNEGRAFGVFNTISFLGAFFAPTIVGFILDRTTGYAAGFLAISSFAFPGLVASLLLGKSLARARS